MEVCRENNIVITGGRTSIKIWSMKPYKLMKTFEESCSCALNGILHFDVNRAVIGIDGNLYMVDLIERSVRKEKIMMDTRNCAIAKLRDNRTVIVTGERKKGKVILMYDMDSRERWYLEGQWWEKDIFGLIAVDCRTFAAMGRDGVIKVCVISIKVNNLLKKIENQYVFFIRKLSKDNPMSSLSIKKLRRRRRRKILK